MKRGGEGHASAPCVATTCFSCAIAAAPTSCHLINAADHLGTRGGSLGWLWANPPSLLGWERPPPACYSSGITYMYLSFALPHTKKCASVSQR